MDKRTGINVRVCSKKPQAVIPANAGISLSVIESTIYEIPACAGMTILPFSEQTHIINKKIRDYLVLLKSKNISFDSALLYGSFAKGNAHEDSDIDLAIIAEGWEPDLFEAQYELMKIARNIDVRIEPRPINKSDLLDPDPFIKEIINTGINISIA